MKQKLLSIILFCFLAINIFAVENQSLQINSSAQSAMSNPSYLVTPGDIFSLNYVAGTEVVSYTIPVDSTYKIRVSNLAVLDAKGKTFVELKKEVENVVTKNYPLSGVQFVLMSPATFTVVVKGEVNKTEERNAWALARLSSVLSGVYTNYSSNRFVTLRRADGTVKKCDLFLASRFGDLSQDPYLQPGDVIEIPRVEKKVTISGEVERAGTYELTSDEGLADLISYYASGLTSYSDLSRIEITKVPAKNSVTSDKIYISAESLEDEKIKNYNVDDNDSIYIGSYRDLQPVIFLEGAILTDKFRASSSSKVSVPFVMGENYSAFFRNNKDIFYSISDTENAYIVRNDEIISIDINKSLFDATYYSDLYLEENDVLVVPHKQLFVTVYGAVNAPGRYEYIPNRTYDYYIRLAGGFNTDRNSNGAVKIVDITGKKQDKNDVIMPEDTITAKTNTFYYYATKYSTLLTTLLTLLTTIISVKTIVGM